MQNDSKRVLFFYDDVKNKCMNSTKMNLEATCNANNKKHLNTTVSLTISILVLNLTFKMSDL